MGFTTGFIGGFTLTSSILYLTLTLHQQNRLKQTIMLRQSSILLNGVVEPSPSASFIPPSARETRAGLADTAKDGWNRQVEGAFRWVQSTDWSEVVREAEGKAGTMWKKAVEKIREEKS